MFLIVKYCSSHFAVPLKLEFESIFNLNNVKEVSVSDSFKSMDEQTKGCQMDLTYDECTTQKYLAALIATCKCLPLKLRVSNEVS